MTYKRFVCTKCVNNMDMDKSMWLIYGIEEGVCCECQAKAFGTTIPQGKYLEEKCRWKAKNLPASAAREEYSILRGI